MAVLHLEDGRTYTRLEEIKTILAPLKVNLNYWSVGENPETINLLAKASLDDTEKEQVLQSLDGYFEELKQNQGYHSRDLIVLHPNLSNLETLLSKFELCHTHADDEVRYVVDGEGVFGFVATDGSQMELTVQAQEYINVPAGTEHWFHLTEKTRIKAVRYFSGTQGWIPEYTGTQIRHITVR
jgi:1,2-dihydroxy-3-keto-5-methylthiopentene dioxygenase